MTEAPPGRGGSRLTRWLLGLTAVILIVLVYPNNLTFPFQFERGQTWRYADLRAPYDVQVLKPREQYDADLEEVRRSATPVYRAQDRVRRRAKADFLEAFEIELDSARANGRRPELLIQPEQQLRAGIQILDRIYDRGIIKPREEELMDGMATVVTLIDGNRIQERTLGQVFTPAEARDFIDDSLAYGVLQARNVLLPILKARLDFNYFYSDSLTNRLRQQALSTVSPYDDLVRENELIVSQGDVVTDDVFQELVSYREIYNRNLSGQATFYSVFGGYAMVVGLVILLLFLYLRRFFPQVYFNTRSLIFILMWPVLYALMIWALEETTGLSTYIVPFCIVPIVMRIFFTERLAFFVHVAVVLITSFLTSLGYSFTFLSIMAGVVVIYMDVDTRDWSRYFRSLILLAAYYFIGYLALELLRGADLWTIEYSALGWLAGNVFLVLFAYPLIPLLERLFGFLSPVTLTELNDMNRPLLETLAREAPGTWQHSLNVANMAERAARQIGADALLVRTAALYHDVGKTANPGYFIENQSGRNPHEQLGELESARIIIGHVTKGIEMAEAAGLPTVLVDFIRTHHGTTRTEYFYRTYVADHPEREKEEGQFRYPGPKPSTKEQTLLMLADSVEAASKSLKQPTEQELFDLIDNVIRGKLTSGQLEDSALSFAELETTRQVFRGILKSAHHLRVAYPDGKEEVDAGPARVGDRITEEE